MELTITGDKAAAAQLEETGRRATTQRQVLSGVARVTAKSISGIPRDTGRLEQSIRPLWVTNTGFAVGSRVPYAGFVFRGTRFMAAQPPHVPDNIADVAARAMAGHIIG